jgi:hypothetical protein
MARSNDYFPERKKLNCLSNTAAGVCCLAVNYCPLFLQEGFFFA